MNKSYTYLDGKVIVIDDNNKQILTEYQDNVDEILKEENLIEEMNKEINDLNNKYDSLKYIKKKKFIPTFIPFFILAVYLCSFVTFDLIGYNSEKMLETVKTIFGEVPWKTVVTNFMVAFTLPAATVLDLISYSTMKDIKKEFSATQSKLEFLNKQIKEEEKYLESLKENHSRESENKQFRSVVISDKEKLQALKYYLLMYEDLGENFDKYNKYYEKGILEDKLKRKFYSDDISDVKNYIEEKRKVMVKK